MNKEIFNQDRNKKARRALRNNMPLPEIILWSKLKGKQFYGYKFRRQHGIGPYVVDFYCSGKKLAIEIDGESHYFDDAKEKDKIRQLYIESLGIGVARFSNKDIIENIDGVLAALYRLIVL